MAGGIDEVGTTAGAASDDASVAARLGRQVVEGRPYVRTLGLPAAVCSDGSDVELSRAQRSVLARLVLAAPHAVSWADLAHTVWGQQRPASAMASIQNQISRIRSAVGEDLIALDGNGYVMRVDTDLAILRSTMSALEDLLLPAATSTRLAGSADETATTSPGLDRSPDGDLLEAAFRMLGRLLTGAMPQVLAGFGAAGLAAAYRRNAEPVVATARIVRLVAAPSTGRWARAVIEGAQLHHESPLDGQVGANYARALALAGRRGEVLSMVAGIRREMRLQLGVDSGPHLDTAEQEILYGLPGSGRASDASASTFRSPPLAGRRHEIRGILQAVAQRHPVRVQGEHGVGVSRRGISPFRHEPRRGAARGTRCNPRHLDQCDLGLQGAGERPRRRPPDGLPRLRRPVPRSLRLAGDASCRGSAVGRPSARLTHG